MGRSILFLFFSLSALYLSAQTGGSNLEFTENKGQWDKRVKYRADMSAGTFYLHDNGYTVVLSDTTDLRLLAERMHVSHDKVIHFAGRPDLALRTPGVVHQHAYKVNFLGADMSAPITPEKAAAGYSNYFIGNDPTKWAEHVINYLGLTYKNIYPGIDLRYYTESGRLKYDLIIHPGADPSQIALRYEGQDGLAVKKGRLVVKTSVSEVKELEPYSYQAAAEGRKSIDCQYVLSDKNTVRFKLKGYDVSQTLVIDPTLVFCSFTGSTSDNWGFTATYGPDGSMFAGGVVHGSGFPTSTGAFQTGSGSGSRNNYWDIGILKLSSNGGSRVYATYLGGSSNEYPHSLVVDKAGQLVVLGRTYSTDYPIYPANNTVGGLGGADIIVTRLNAAGSALVGSMKIGGSGDDGVNTEDQGEKELSPPPPGGGSPLRLIGLVRNYGDWSRSECIVDDAGNIFVATSAMSQIAGMGGSFSPNLVGGQDGLVMKINPGVTSVIWGAYLGGTGDDAALSLDLNPLTNDVYVAGSTSSTNFAGMGASSYQSTLGGSISGYVSIISNDGSTLKGSTYLSCRSSTSVIDMVYGIKFDKKGFPYVMGTSTGTWAVKNATYSNAGSKQFVVKLKTDLSDIVYSTTFGSVNATKPNISPVAFLVDRCENVYVSGWGGWYSVQQDPYNLQGPAGMPTSADAIQKTTDNHDFYFIVLKRNASALLYGTFFGQVDDATSIGEHVDGGTSRYDRNGIIYEGICANCYRGDPSVRTGQQAFIKFPTTNGAYSVGNKAGTEGCNMAVVKIAFNYSGVGEGLKASLDGRGDSIGCVPLTVTLFDTIRNAKQYIWEYGDGSKRDSGTASSVTHTYTQVGVYRVMEIAIDSTSCNISDTAYRTIYVRDNRATLNFTMVKNAPCTALSYKFTNTSTETSTAPPFTPTSFIWDFGDGTPQVAAPVGPPGIDHPYAAPGTYRPKLILVDTNYCNYPDTLEQRLGVAENVKAQFETPATGCAPYLAVFNNTSIAGATFFWDFGDGTTSTDFAPAPHLYPNPGPYTITLRADDPNTCNKTDIYSFTITLQQKPTASFTWAPNPPAANTPTVFSSSSSADVIKWEWIFGDGYSTVKTREDTVMHQYNETGTFQACLVVTNSNGCTDTSCQSVSALINPLLDVPNAFTPGRFGQNGIVKVMGFGITKMTWRIYNRWGQMVFQSNDRNIGWDGTYKGALQAQDVYAYTLEAEFFDGKHVTKRGDITLIR